MTMNFIDKIITNRVLKVDIFIFSSPVCLFSNSNSKDFDIHRNLKL